MAAPFAAAVAAVAASHPMRNESTDPIPGRVLLVDGDGLAYYCAGNDDTAPGMARRTLIDKVEAAKIACGAERVIILVTGRGSHKGHRYAVARVKPYQGQRTSGRRPKNWEYLRDLLECKAISGFDYDITVTAEADDLFGKYVGSGLDCVIYTQDKDMRMIDGAEHLDWKTHVSVYVPKGAWLFEYNDKVYGRAWLWIQMLMGDTADNIPGLPKFKLNEEDKPKLCGEVTAHKLVRACACEDEASELVCSLYKSFYGDAYKVELFEQAVLLWMRTDPNSLWHDVFAVNNPLRMFYRGVNPAEFDVIRKRVEEAEAICASSRQLKSLRSARKCW